MILRLIVAAFCAVFLTSCATVSSYRLAGSDAQSPSGTNAGSYFLARHVMKVTVSDKDITVSSEAVADRNSIFQLGFNLSPLAHDDIKVEYTSSGLLKSLTSINHDKTGEILKEGANAVGLFRSTEVEGQIKVSEFTFNPFDSKEAARVNRLLRQAVGARTCVSIEVLPGAWSPGCGNLNPFAERTVGSYNTPTPASIASTLNAVEPGIYYRRPLDHRVFVSFRGRAFKTTLLKFANFAPVLQLDVNRTTFVDRKTSIVFDTSGALQSVQVDKPSEALAVVKLPATIVGAYIGAIVQGFTNAKSVQSARADLLNQQAATLEAERKLVEAIAAGNNTNAANRALSLSRSTAFRSVGIESSDFRAAPSPGRVRTQDMEQTFRNIGACQDALGESVSNCMELMRNAAASGIQ